MDRARVQDWLDRYLEAWRTYDPALIGDLFSEDAEYRFHPFGEPVRGREAHRKYFEAALAREPQRKLTLTSIRSQRVGELCYDAGEWTQVLGAMGAKGYYLTVYRREGNVWKATVTIFNVRS